MQYSLTDVIDLFLVHLKAASRQPDTIDSYRRRFRRFAAYHEIDNGMSLSAITPELLDRWAASLRDENLASATRRGYIQALKTLFTFCANRGYTPINRGIDLERPKLDHNAHDKVMPVQTLYALLDVAQAQAERGQPRDLAILMFMADTGCRRGEVVTLRGQDLLLDKLDAYVTGKSGDGLVDYTIETADALRLWLDARPQVDHDFVFTGLPHPGSPNQGQPLKPGAINSIFKRLAKAAGVTGRCNPHSIRHLVGQTMTDHVNLELVRQKLRHTNISTTAMFYSHQDRSRVKAATQLHTPLNGYRKEDL